MIDVINRKEFHSNTAKWLNSTREFEENKIEIIEDKLYVDSVFVDDMFIHSDILNKKAMEDEDSNNRAKWSIEDHTYWQVFHYKESLGWECNIDFEEDSEMGSFYVK